VILGGGAHTLTVAVTVEPLSDSDREPAPAAELAPV
jgi:hypothetical protein